MQRVASRKGGGGGGGRAPPPGMDYSARVKAVEKQSEVLMAQLALLEKCKISSSDKKTNAYFTDYDMLLESCSVLFNNVPIEIEGCSTNLNARVRREIFTVVHSRFNMILLAFGRKPVT